MKKILTILFAVASLWADNECFAITGTWINGKFVEDAGVTFWKWACPTEEKLNEAVNRYLKGTNQTDKLFVIEVTDHAYILHFVQSE